MKLNEAILTEDSIPITVSDAMNLVKKYGKKMNTASFKKMLKEFRDKPQILTVHIKMGFHIDTGAVHVDIT